MAPNSMFTPDYGFVDDTSYRDLSVVITHARHLAQKCVSARDLTVRYDHLQDRCTDDLRARVDCGPDFRLRILSPRLTLCPREPRAPRSRVIGTQKISMYKHNYRHPIAHEKVYPVGQIGLTRLAG